MCFYCWYFGPDIILSMHHTMASTKSKLALSRVLGGRLDTQQLGNGSYSCLVSESLPMHILINTRTSAPRIPGIPVHVLLYDPNVLPMYSHLAGDAKVSSISYTAFFSRQQPCASSSWEVIRIDEAKGVASSLASQLYKDVFRDAH